MKNALNTFANINIYIGIALLVIPVIFLLFTGVNNNSYTTVSANNTNQEILSEEVIDPSYKADSTRISTTEQILVPTKNAVTYGNKIQVKSVGIDALIYECATSVCGLTKGVWRLPDFGTPINDNSPIVLAAHRWGPDNLSTADRIKNLFYNADKIFEGDMIELTWNNKVYKYKVTYKEENSYITKNSDLILVTCKYYNSDIRIIVYAKKI